MLSLTIITVACDSDHVHSYTDFRVQKEATCAEDGEIRVYCECEDYVSHTLQALGHTYGEWEEKQSATATVAGRKERECTRCHHVDVGVIPAKGLESSVAPSLYVSFDNRDSNNNFYDGISGTAFYNHLGVSDVSGKNAKSASFGGSNYLEMSTTLPLGNSPHTVAAWIKASPSSLIDGEYVIAGWGTSSTAKNTVLSIRNNRLTATNYGTRVDCELPADFSSAWHHVAMTYDGNSYRLYLDGVLKGSATVLGGIAIENSPLFVGGFKGSMKYYGDIDDLMIFDTALSAEELEYYMANTGGLSMTAPTNVLPLSDNKRQFDINGTTLKSGWNKFNYEYNGVELSCALHIPNRFDPEKSYPLLVSLHGDGFINKTIEEIIVCGDNAFAKRAVAEGDDCITLVAVETEVWLDVPGLRQLVGSRYYSRNFNMSEATPSGELNAVENLTDLLIANYPVDSTRVYLSGYSRGCMASWYLMRKTPEKYAGAVLACGPGDPSIASEFASVPIWLYCGDLDDMAYYDDVKAIYDAYEAAGGQGKFIICTGGDHGAPGQWINNDPDVVDWLFSQKKSV